MKVNVLTELDSSRQKRKRDNQQNAVILETQKLLEHDTQRDLHILRSIGQQSTFAQSETERGEILELEKKEDYLGGKVFTKAQIVKLGVKYRLKFLQAQHYCGYIDPSITAEVKELERQISKKMTADQAAKRDMSVEDYVAENGAVKYEFDNHVLKTKFYILAPAKSFKTEKTKMFTTKAADPVLFYTDDENHFRVIKKWGSDFTVMRRLKGFVTQSWFNHIFYLYILPYMAVTSALSIFLSPYCLYMFGLVAVFCIWRLVMADGISLDHRFVGDNHATSINSFYM